MREALQELFISGSKIAANERMSVGYRAIAATRVGELSGLL
jgi:hypothetical protein